MVVVQVWGEGHHTVNQGIPWADVNSATHFRPPSERQKGPHVWWCHRLPRSPLQARKKVRVVCSRPYHALFMHNMLIRPTAEELLTFGEPDMVIYNAGTQRADSASGTAVCLSLERGELVILGRNEGSP